MVTPLGEGCLRPSAGPRRRIEIQGHRNNGALFPGRPLVGGEGRRMTSLDRVDENRRARVVDIQGGWGDPGALWAVLFTLTVATGLALLTRVFMEIFS